MKSYEYMGDAEGITDCILILLSFMCLDYECAACHTEQRGYDHVKLLFQTGQTNINYLN